MTAEEKLITQSALDRVELKIDKFITEQQNVNNRVFNTLEKLESTLNKLDTTLQVKQERETHFIRAVERSHAAIEKSEQRIDELERIVIKTEATIKTLKFIIFTMIPLLPTIAGIVTYFVR